MKTIQMVDLKGQYDKISDEIDNAIKSVINSCAFINGPAVKEFQTNLEKYLQVKHVIPCANGTDALQLSLMALNLKPGDEIITTAFTFVSTVEVIVLLNLKPVFVDVDPHTFNINVEKIENAITNKTRAILPVHLFGQAADMEKIMQIAEKYQLYVIEDNCQAIGCDFYFNNSTTKKTGTIGHIGCTSFFPSKNLGCYGDGGAISTNDDELAEKIRAYANHGMKTRYYYDYIGINSRLDSIQAAILNVKLKYLNDYIKKRQEAAEFYNKTFKDIKQLTIPYRFEKSSHVYHQYTLKISDINRNDLQKYLSEKGIPSMIYYPVPLHLQKAYEFLGYKKGDLPETEKLSETVLSLPMHTELDEEQLSYITSAIKEYINNNK